MLVVGTAGAAIAANQDGTAVVKDPKDPDKSQMDEINESGGMNKAPMQGLFDSAPEEESSQRAQGGTVPFSQVWISMSSVWISCIHGWW